MTTDEALASYTPVQARSVEVEVTWSGSDITDSIRPFLLDLTYTDAEEDESDDLKLTLQDRPLAWMYGNIEKAITAGAAAKLKVSAVIRPKDWGYDNPPLYTGEFEVDSIEASGLPATVSISCAALPYSAAVRQTRKTKAWENYTLSGIANEIAYNAGLGMMYESPHNPTYEREEQNDKSDIDFLSDLCHDAGLSLKCTDNALILFDQSIYEAKEPIMTIRRDDKSYLDYSLSTGSADTQYSRCHVSYTDPQTGKVIEGTYYDTTDDDDTGQCLEIKAKCANEAEAVQLAENWLRMRNKFSRTASFTLPGNTSLVAGVTLLLVDWGGWDGKYMVKQATHTIGGSGYTTQIDLRKVEVS